MADPIPAGATILSFPKPQEPAAATMSVGGVTLAHPSPKPGKLGIQKEVQAVAQARRGGAWGDEPQGSRFR